MGLFAQNLLAYNYFAKFIERGANKCKETHLYYLQSRYYNPATGRFLNADAFTSTGDGTLGNNMFAYCGNNPINSQDSSGFAGIGVLSNTKDGFLRESGSAGLSGDVLALLLTYVTIAPFVEITSKRLSKEDVKEDSIAITGSQEEDSNYWVAVLTNNIVVPIEPLTYAQAQIWVASGNNLLCKNHAAAIGIVKFWPSAKWDGRHGCKSSGYLNHYHLSSAHDNHVWYYGE